ncbi:MAG: SDR family NAD(P)-dependent oxidoreductase [Bdellovibrionales bacterium]|nr:SDR family NAD(P)-dependent oxidoreductase [Bdellovibrionales bacterium]
MKSFLEKQILITGADRGIGFHFCSTLLEKGHKVWAGVKELKSNEQVGLNSLLDKHPKKLKIVPLDVTSPRDIDNLVGEIDIQLNSEFILINNAGLPGAALPVEVLRSEIWQETFAVNFFAVVNLTQAFLPTLRKTKGRVINIGSITGDIAVPMSGAYCSSKFALRGFNDCLRRELQAFGVRVIFMQVEALKTPIWQEYQKKSMQELEACEAEGIAIYHDAIERNHAFVQSEAEHAGSIDCLNKPILHSVQSARPKKYYHPGGSNWVLSRILPASWIDRILDAKINSQKSES